MSTTKKINDGSIKLTRDNITQGRLGEKIRSISGSDKVLTKEELLMSEEKLYLIMALVMIFMYLLMVLYCGTQQLNMKVNSQQKYMVFTEVFV